MRIPAGASTDIQFDPDFAGKIGSLSIEPGYNGTLALARSLTIRGDLTLGGGQVTGGDGPLVVEGSATVNGGVLTTPRGLMSVKSLTIAQSGVVRLGANGKLDLTGDGTPLTGDGLLDVTTNAPNSVEYTGHAASDLRSAGPATTLHGLARTRAAVGNAQPLAPATFTETGSLTLDQGENGPVSAVIDPASGYAYFGTGTTPGVIVKVRLSDFARVGALTLNLGENELTSAAIDTSNGFSYFGTIRGSIAKLRLSDFTAAGVLTLNPGESAGAAVIDTVDGFAYLGGYRTVVKLRLSDFTRVGALTLSDGEAYIASGVVGVVNGYAYFGTYNSPSIIVRVDLANLAFAHSANQVVAKAGDPLTYALSVSNDGPFSATGLTLTDTLPLSVTFVSATPGPTTCNLIGNQVTCNLGTLPVGASTQVTIQVTIDPSITRAALVNTSSVSANEPRFGTSQTRLMTLINPLNVYFPLVQR